MPDTGAPWNIPYVAGTDLVRDWPTDSQELAEAVADGLDAANLGIGTNLVQATKLDTFSTTSTSYTDITGLTATITPSSATAKVLIVVQLNVSTTPTDGHITAVGIGGGNAAAYVGATASNRTTMASGVRLGTPYDYSRSVVTLSVVYLDSPATTSATTYAAQVKAVGGTAYVNRSHFDDNNNAHPRAASSITVIEVAV